MEFLDQLLNADSVLEELGEKLFSEFTEVYLESVYAEVEIEKLILKAYEKSEYGYPREELLWFLGFSSVEVLNSINIISRLSYLRSYQKGYDFIPIQICGDNSEIDDVKHRYKDNQDEMNRIISHHIEAAMSFIRELIRNIKTDQKILDTIPREFIEL